MLDDIFDKIAAGTKFQKKPEQSPIVFQNGLLKTGGFAIHYDESDESRVMWRPALHGALAVTGSAASGKTTLIRHMLKAAKGSRLVYSIDFDSTPHSEDSPANRVTKVVDLLRWARLGGEEDSYGGGNAFVFIDGAPSFKRGHYDWTYEAYRDAIRLLLELTNGQMVIGCHPKSDTTTIEDMDSLLMLVRSSTRVPYPYSGIMAEMRTVTSESEQFRMPRLEFPSDI